MAILFDQNGPSMPSGVPASQFPNGLTVPVGSATTLAGTNTLSGATTISGAATVSGAAAFTGGTAGVTAGTPVVGTADVVITAAQSGTMFVANKGSGNQLFTLPAAAAGLRYTFVCKNASTGMTIKTGDATAVMHAKTAAAGTAITSTANTGSLVNSTAVVGDTLTLVCDGTDWWMCAQSGIFAAT
jgi:hypothetical protein